MVKLIHAATGGATWVHETRVAEYLAAGYRPAAETAAAADGEAKPAVAHKAVSNSDTAKPTRKTTRKKAEK